MITRYYLTENSDPEHEVTREEWVRVRTALDPTIQDRVMSWTVKDVSGRAIHMCLAP